MSKHFHTGKNNKLINYGSGLVVFSVLLFWGGLFGMESSESFSIGILRVQDITSFLGIGLIILGTIIRGTISRSFINNIFLFGMWLLFGVCVGLLNGNSLNNIGFEARGQMYVLFGAIVSSNITKDKVKSYLNLSALLIAAAVIIQWLFIILNVNFLLLSGGNIGNIFTLNIPLVRPGGGFHLVGIGLILAIGPWSEGILLSAVILGIAVIISQSKTYWMLSAFALFISPFLNRRFRFWGIVRNITLAFFAIILLYVVFSTAGSLLFLKNVSPIEKFTAVFTDRDIRFGVLDVRQIELNYVNSILKKSNPAELFFGRGLGYIYHPLNAVFYRSDIRDQEVLAMFVHNTLAWVMLKFGLIGIIFIFIILLFVLRRIRIGSIYQKQLGFVLLMLVIGSLAMGTFQDPLSAFLFGLLAVEKVY